MNVFKQAQSVGAATVARKAGIRLKKQGDREWCCCPIHSERTPSCCFYPDGRWYCFCCHKGGDAVDLYCALYGTSKLQAAYDIKQQSPYGSIQQEKPRKKAFLDGADAEGLTWNQLCDIRHLAVELLDKAKGDDVWQFVKIIAETDNRLDLMWEMMDWNY